MTGLEQIAEERNLQIEKHGRTVEGDAAVYVGDHSRDLSKAAVVLIGWDTGEIVAYAPEQWMLNLADKQPGYIERLRIAGALIAAEIDHVQFINHASEGSK